MKVLQVISGNDNGGGANHVLNICKYSKDKFKSVLGSIGPGPMNQKAMQLGVSFQEFGGGAEIVEYIKNNDIDMVNFHGAKAFFTYFLIKNKIKVPTVATVHSNFNQDFLNNKIKYYLFTPLSKLGLKAFDNYICISNYIMELLDQENFKGEKYLVSNGIDFNEIKIGQDRETIRKNNGIEEDEFLYINVARMHPIKNQQGLLEAFKLLSEEISQVKLLFIGDGPMLEELVKEAERLHIINKVVFLGFKENPLDFINASEVNVLTSFSEGGSPPLCFLEAAAAKKTTISTSVGDVDKSIDSHNIFLIKNNTKEEIYEKMKEAYENRNLLEEMGNNLLNEVKLKFSTEKFIEKYHEHYVQIIRRNNDKKQGS